MCFQVLALTIPFTHSIAAICWIAHYAKRILETLFVHRFSHATMPIRNLFRNCAYYWIFAAYVAYHINHPLYTAPCQMQSYIALGFWTVSVGSLHMSTNRRIQITFFFPGVRARKL